jgi:hypothetical protein
MKFRTEVAIPKSTFKIKPCEDMLFVGSCFADNIGARFIDEKFRAVVNPFGVMYNPASILHTVKQTDCAPQTAVFTLGTNHVYILKETGEIVDNCQKRPQRLFREEELSIEECFNYLLKAVETLIKRNASVHVIITVSPIRYAKYGFHESALSKATLLLAADKLAKSYPDTVTYFPAYEIMNDELRDYRFYKADMLHPSEQAVEFIYEQFADTFFAPETFQFLDKWHPIRAALSHKPFNPDSEEYKTFLAKTNLQYEELKKEYPNMP